MSFLSNLVVRIPEWDKRRATPARHALGVRTSPVAVRSTSSFCLHRVDAIPIGRRGSGLQLLTPLDIELARVIVRGGAERLPEELNGLFPLPGSIGLQALGKALHQRRLEGSAGQC